MKVLHLITGLNVGGAETMLAELLAETRTLPNVENLVASMTDNGLVGQRIQELGIPVHALEMKPGWPDVRGFFRLKALVNECEPTIVQTWLHHADLLGGLTAWLANVPVVWGIHFTASPHQNAKWHRRLSMHLSGLISRSVPAQIICCSETALREHADAGYAAEKLHVIHNGVSTRRFLFSSEARESLREKLGIPLDAFVVGMPARFHPQKDHRNFFRAAEAMHGKVSTAHFVLCGSGMTRENPDLARLMEGLSKPEQFHLLGECSEMDLVYSSMDLVTLSSDYEALPLALLEAMSSSRPCVATNVGDCARIVGDAGTMVPRGDFKALAQGWQAIAEMPIEAREELGKKARRRIENEFSLEVAADRYLNVYRQFQLNGSAGGEDPS